MPRRIAPVFPAVVPVTSKAAACSILPPHPDSSDDDVGAVAAEVDFLLNSAASYVEP